MLSKNRGIVLHQIKHKDNCIILHVYSVNNGRKSYILRTSKNKKMIPHTLSVIDFESSSQKNNGGLGSISEWTHSVLLTEITENISKSAIALFIGEILYKLIREEEKNEQLFNFLEKSIHMLDSMNKGIANFHLYFLIRLADFLGFSIPLNRNYFKYFDIKKSEFTSIRPLHPLFFDENETKVLSNLQKATILNFGEVQLDQNLRFYFSKRMIDFYAFHFDYILPIRSINVLHEIFS